MLRPVFKHRNHVIRILQRGCTSQNTLAPGLPTFMNLYERITHDFKLGNLDSCVSLSEEAIQVAKQAGDVPWKDVAAVQLNLSHILKLLNRVDDATGMAKRALASLDSHFSSCKPEVCHALDVVAELCTESNEFDEALKLTNRAIELKTRLYGAHCVQLAKTYNIRGAVFFKQDQLASSREEFIRALGLHVREFGRNRPLPVPIGITLSNFAGALRRDPLKVKECVAIYRAVVESFSEANSSGSDTWMEGNALCDLGESLVESGSQAELEEARECFTRALHIFLSTRGIDHPSTSRATFLLQKTTSIIPKLDPLNEVIVDIVDSLIDEAITVVPPKSTDIRVSGDVLFLDRRGHVGHAHPHKPLF
jgi:tetratricopeptide (TPR) repeat protein